MIGSGTFFGGHHTVYQHAHFEFGLENVSRQFVWSFLHAHPFYNSEQQSQRYVRLDRAQAYVPPAETPHFGPAERAIYEKAIARAWDHYRELTALLDAQRARNSGGHLARRPDVARQARAEGRAAIGKARHRSGALRFARRGVHHDGAHAFRHRAAPPVAHAGGERHAHPNRGRSSAKWSRASAKSIRNSSIASTTSRWKICRNGSSRRATDEAFAREFDARLGGLTSRLIDYSPNTHRRRGRSLSRRAGPDRRRVLRRRSDRPPAQPRAQSLSPRNAERRRACADDARAAAREFHLRQEDQPHRRQPGPAPSHGAGFAPAAHSGRHAFARLHHAHADPRQSARARNLPAGHGRSVEREE